MKKRILSLLLAMVMMVGMLPVGASAHGEGNVIKHTEDMVAKVGDTAYASFGEALEAWVDGTTLSLLADVSDLAEKIIVSSKTVTLDLNGHELGFVADYKGISVGQQTTTGYTLSGELILCDSAGGGEIRLGTGNISLLKGALTIESGTVYGPVTTSNDTNFLMTGGAVIAEASEGRTGLYIRGSATITGGSACGQWGLSTYSTQTIVIGGDVVLTGGDYDSLNPGAAISKGRSETMIISGTPTLRGGSGGEIYVSSGSVILNTQPAEGEVWSVSMAEAGVFAVPGEGITLDPEKFRSAEEGRNLGMNEEGALYLCDHSVPGMSLSAGDGTTHKTLCMCGEETLEELIPCYGGAGTATCISGSVCEGCGGFYGETDPAKHAKDSYTNGLRDCCGEYQPAEEIGGVYQIGSAGQLMWFSQQVNGGQYALNAVLTADIDMITLPWEAMGLSWETAYTGTFDGEGHVISNLSYNAHADEGMRQSFIYYLGEGGTVKNVTFLNADVFTHGHANANGSAVVALRNCGTVSGVTVKDSRVQLGNYAYLAGIVGCNESTGVIENCAVINTVIRRRFSRDLPSGGIVHKNLGVVKNCYSYGAAIEHSHKSNGGILVEGNAPVNSYYYTTYTVVETDYAMSKEAFHSGEVAYILGEPWGQKIGVEDSPVLGGEKVFYGYTSCATEQTAPVYANGAVTEEKPTHYGGVATCAKGEICERCGEEYGEKNLANHDPDCVPAYLPGESTTEHIISYPLCGQSETELHIGGTESCISGRCCSLCGMEYSHVLDPNNHHETCIPTYSLNSYGTMHILTYSQCGKTVKEYHTLREVDGICSVCGFFAAQACTTVGGVKTYFVFLQDALTSLATAKEEDGAVVSLMGDVSLLELYADIVSGEFTLDLNGQRISASTISPGALVLKGGKITITDSVGGGSIFGYPNIYARGDSVVIIEGGALTGYSGLRLAENATVIIKGGSITLEREFLEKEGENCRLILTEGEDGSYPLFYGSVDVLNTTLCEILGEGMAYYVDGKKVAVTADQTRLEGEEIAIRKCGDHTQEWAYEDNGDDTHSRYCPCCGTVVETSAHSYTDRLCVCGKVFYTYVEKGNWKFYHSLNLASDISVNLCFPKAYLAGFPVENVYVEAVIAVYEGNEKVGTKTLRLSPVEKGDYYYFTLTELTAVQMNDIISSVLYCEKDGVIYYSPVDEYSIATYAYAKLNKADTKETLKALCAEILRYGANAQIYKSYRTDALVDSAMTEEHRAYLSDLSALTFGDHNTVLDDLDEPLAFWEGKALNLESKVEVKFIYKYDVFSTYVENHYLMVSYINSKGEEVSVRVDGAERYGASSGFWPMVVFTIDFLNASELRTVLNVQIYENGVPISCTLQYSADTYGNDKDGDLGALCKALFAYSDSAKAFFAN